MSMNSGIIIVNKEKGYTSRDVVNIVSKYLNIKKVGHTGTLDPLATGVLVIGYNKATKIFELLFSDDKEYIAEVKMGIETDTLDIEGNIINKDDSYIVNKDILQDVLNSFKGSYNQEVPIYSAIKINGKKLYEYARNKEAIELPKRMVNIKEIELLDFNGDTFSFRCVVSKGTYIRSLIRDIGKSLDICCTMSNLKRTRQGIFKIEDSNRLDDIKNNNYKVISIKEALSNYKQIEVDEELLFKVSNGQKLYDNYEDNIIVFIHEDEVIAIYEKSNDYYKSLKVLI